MRLNQGEICSEFQCSDLFEMLNCEKNNVTFPGFRLILSGFWFFKFANWFLGDDRKVGEGYSLSSAWLLKN